MKKTLCALLAALLLASMAGCSADKDSNTDLDNPNGDVQQNDDKATLPEVELTEYDLENVMNVGGTDISAALYRYFLLNLRSQYAGITLEGTDIDSIIEEQVVAYLKQYAAADVMAKELSVTVSDEAKEELDAYLAEVVAQINADESTSYEAELAAANMTDKVFRDLQNNSLTQSQIYVDKYRGTATSDEIVDYVHENYVRVKHILIKTQDLDDEQKAEARSRADGVLERAKNGENFEDLVKEYSEDGMDVDVGYYFTYDEMVQEFEDKSYELEIGEISDIVESPYGYHIIKKYAMDDDYIRNEEELNEVIDEKICENRFYADLEEKAETLEVVYGENFDTMREKILNDESAETIDDENIAENVDETADGTETPEA